MLIDNVVLDEGRDPEAKILRREWKTKPYTTLDCCGKKCSRKMYDRKGCGNCNMKE